MLNLPVYRRGHTYYLHTRIAGRQFKRSLRTSDTLTAMIRATKLLEAVAVSFDLSKIRKYELDLSNGIVRADGPEDHGRLMDALDMLLKVKQATRSAPPAPAPQPPQGEPVESLGIRPATQHGLTLLELLDKYLLLKQVKPATVTALRNTCKELTAFFQSKCYIADILVSDITRYQEFMAGKGNVPRTIDGKVGYIKTLLNFAIKQGYLTGKNPAENMSLLTKQQKLTGGYAIFELDEIKAIFDSEYFRKQKEIDPDYYYVLLLGLATGCRVNEITSLQFDQFKVSPKSTNYIVLRDAKTHAGKREIPLPAEIFTDDFKAFIKQKKEKNDSPNLFKYAPREGKGAGNAVGKKFSRHMEEVKVSREKLVFHSLRKFLNDHFMKNGVEFEPRCQFFGHAVENVNVATYSNIYNVDDLAEITNSLQTGLLVDTKIIGRGTKPC